MRFANPEWLYALPAIVLLTVLLWWRLGRKARALTQVLSAQAITRVAPEFSPIRSKLKVLLWGLATFWLCVAMARPQWGKIEETVKTTGLDIVIALDVSNSMEAEDVSPSRAKRAKAIIRSLLERLGGDRVGIVAFAGSAFPASPLTTDHAYVWGQVEVLDSNAIQNQGTDLGAALTTSALLLAQGAEETAAKDASQGTRVILLVSDGEDHEEQAEEIAKKLVDSGVRIYAIGIGTEKGGPIPLRDDSGRVRGMRKGPGSEPIVTKFNPAALENLTRIGGGKFWGASQLQSEVEGFLSEVGGLNRTENAEKKLVSYQERFQWPLSLALFFLVLELVVRRSRLVGKKTGHTLFSRLTTGAMIWLICFAQTGLESRALAAEDASSSQQVDKDQSTSPGVYLLNRQGAKRLEDGNPEAALEAFREGLKRTPGAPVLKYNEGTALLGTKDSKAASEALGEAADKLKKADHPLAADALYNTGILNAKEGGDVLAAAASYAAAIEEAKRHGNKELEKRARANLSHLKLENKGGGSGQSEQEQKEQESKESESGEQEKQNPQQYKQNQKQPYRSKELSKEAADRVLRELTEREKELRGKLMQERGNPGDKEKDW